ncbi:hypothetical protein HPB51_020942 [Rhipicephalus microplus]|uniref:Alpha-macroglobulin receptor-binding domain-containing protein n=1 Tax=Rhipicephalus microplus TaxID=6941 RepID=A0A9J6ECN7_RHIMP|nr:hypothetical protein HPB51_020942 [Rhipicephalus microplus]
MNSLSTGYEATGVDVEGTSYALLAHLKHNDMDSSKKFVNWLLRHRSASGSFVSTQDTVVALQALSEYSIQASTAAPDISGMVLADNTPQLLRVKRENAALLQEFLIINARGKIVVNATGTGTAALNVKLRYNVLAPPQQNCKRYQRPDVALEERQPRADKEGGFVVVEKGIFSEKALQAVSKNFAPVGKREVKAVTETCLKFRIEKEFDVTNLQTSTVRVYDYYDGSVSPSQSNVVWKGNVSANYVIAGYRHIAFYIDKVIKEGEENETIKGQTRLLVGRQLCNTSNLDVGREYIIFGKDSDQVIDGDTRHSRPALADACTAKKSCYSAGLYYKRGGHVTLYTYFVVCGWVPALNSIVYADNSEDSIDPESSQ